MKNGYDPVDDRDSTKYAFMALEYIEGAIAASVTEENFTVTRGLLEARDILLWCRRLNRDSDVMKRSRP